ncbi:HD domain-containing phosphohydrolase [Brevibacillus dissolubilis]|uniref:HD domain-containing phosphohydrolase n=1 Tax=Brevibacillus dissolubilis TaxID=1844116 RepID=UPI0011165D34|nr:HD domain-containing phosphohydrolase [Brevibacillus dissolubilis]
MITKLNQFQKFSLFLILLPVLFTLIVYYGYLQVEKEYRSAGIRDLEAQMKTILHTLQLFDEEVMTGQRTKIEAEVKAKEFLVGPMMPNGQRDLTRVKVSLGDGDYLYAFDTSGQLVMHPTLEGQNIEKMEQLSEKINMKELAGNPYRTFVFKWGKLGRTDADHHVTLIRYYPEWGWFIGLSSSEEHYYELFKYVKFLLIFLVAGSYVITAILVYLAERKERELRRSERLSEQLAQTNQSILKSLAVALEERDSYTSGHSQRVAYYMKVIARKMDLPEELVESIYTGGLLHDIGKIGIEDSILLKAGRLTEEEYQTIKTHPTRGEALLRKLYAHASMEDSHKITTILAITRWHHERFDGLGYPDQIKGMEIPLVARIAAVADSFDAMTSSRPYRQSMAFTKAYHEILRCKGSQFCPEIVDVFAEAISEETFLHAHHITRADEMLFEPVSQNIYVKKQA